MSESSAPRAGSEVRPYLKRLVLAILLGVVVMASTAVWAWNTYGTRLESAPPLPSGVPPINTAEQSTR